MAAKDLTPQERERRSELAKKLNAEGKFGGREYGKLGGRPRKPRVSALVAEEASANAQAIVDVFKDAIDKSQDIRVRLKAASEWMNIEVNEEELRIKEERALEGMQRDQLIGEVAKRVGALVEGGLLDPRALGLPGGDALEASHRAADGTWEVRDSGEPGRDPSED